jgi:predicted ribosome quality control (RQC) complex YloA/Tae2 family protein
MTLKLTRKNSMTYFDLLAWIVENSNQVNCRIDNIYSTAIPNLFIFKLHCGSSTRDLIIEPGKRIHFTKYDREKIFDTKARVLRELIRDSIIKKVEILDEERIIKLELSNNKIVYIELLPRGLLVITDINNKILFSTEYKEFKDRIIKPGSIYTAPPKTQLNKEDLEKNIKKGNIAKILGVPQEIIIALGITVSSIEDLGQAKEKINELINNLKKGQIEPCISDNNVMPIEFNGCQKRPSFNDALDDYFTNLEKTETSIKRSEKIEEEKRKLEITISQILQAIEEDKKKEEELRKIGKMVMENYDKLEKEIQKNTKKFIIKIDNLEIELDPKISVLKNASKYFDEAKIYSQKAKKAEETLEVLKKKLSDINSKIEEKNEESASIFKKREWYEKYRWAFTRNGYLVIAGKDQDQNDSLVRKLLEEKDIFLHANIQGAATTIIKNPSNVDENDLKDAAVIAACYSKAWKIGLGAVDVFWVYGNQVSKSPPTGEYLPKGSFMIYGKKNFINNVKLKLAIGICKDNNIFNIIVGSEDVVSQKCELYAVVTPGNEDPSKTSERLAKIFSKKLFLSSKMIQSEISKLLPGKCSIIKIETVKDKSETSLSNNNP